MSGLYIDFADMEDNLRSFLYNPEGALPMTALNRFTPKEQLVLQRIHSVFCQCYERVGEQGRMDALHVAIRTLPAPYNVSGHQLRELAAQLWRSNGVMDQLGIPKKKMTDVEFTLDAVICTHSADI